MPSPPLALVVALIGAALAVGGLLALRASGARFAHGRRLAGAAELKVGELLELDELPEQAIRVAGRVRCPEPIVTPQDDRLVALHRDVEVLLPRGGWRRIEHLRETRTFELWDHDGSVLIDPAEAAEPLVSIPHVWRGSVDELDESYRPGLERVTAEHGAPTTARATTRMISVVDRLLVVGRAERGSDGTTHLAPAAGGYIISALELDAGLRLLGGRRRGLLLVGAAAVAGGLLLATLGLVAATAGLFMG